MLSTHLPLSIVRGDPLNATLSSAVEPWLSAPCWEIHGDLQPECGKPWKGEGAQWKCDAIDSNL